MSLLKYCASMLLLATSVSYAAQPSFQWNRPYLGGFIGGAFGEANLTTHTGTVTGSSYFISNEDIGAVNHSGSPSMNPSAFMAGIQLGDDVVIDNYIVGLILDFGAFNLSTDTNEHGIYPDGSGNYTEKTSIKSDWLYTMRARVGYLVRENDPFLVYITGGLAITNPTLSNEFSDESSLSGVGGRSDSSIQAGWTTGLGLEFPIYQHFTINAEYLFVQFNTVEINSTITNNAGGFGILPNSLSSPLTTSADLYANLLKIGFNYKF